MATKKTARTSGSASSKKTTSKQSSSPTSSKKTAASTAKNSSAKKPAKKATTTKKATTKKATTKAASATKATKKTTTKKKPSTKGATLPVRPDESPWTAAEVAGVRTALEDERGRLMDEIAAADADIDALMRDGSEGAGNDQADVGSNSFERDHEISLAKNARHQVELIDDALARLDDGTFGICESCGQPVGKLRLEAFPRATLCMECKRKQERR